MLPINWHVFFLLKISVFIIGSRNIVKEKIYVRLVRSVCASAYPDSIGLLFIGVTIKEFEMKATNHLFVAAGGRLRVGFMCVDLSAISIRIDTTGLL